MGSDLFFEDGIGDTVDSVYPRDKIISRDNYKRLKCKLEYYGQFLLTIQSFIML